jgi:hypothetical protein
MTHSCPADAAPFAGLGDAVSLAGSDFGRNILDDGELHGCRPGSHGFGAGLRGWRPSAHEVVCAPAASAAATP